MLKRKSTKKRTAFKATLLLLLVTILIFPVFPVMADTPEPKAISYEFEYLDRGLIAAKVNSGVFLSWRFFKEEVTGYSDTGLTGAVFNVYRDNALIATVTDSTNYLDPDGTINNIYTVKAVINGKEKDQSEPVKPLANGYIEVPMLKPKDVELPDGKKYAYSAGDMSVGDVDGDGVYEYFVKWEANPQDVIGKGFTGNVLIDCYKLDGTLLYRIDLGKNIRSGAHYTQFLVYDFDGDGKCEIILKTAPGTNTVKVGTDGTEIESTRQYITMLQEDIDAGYSHDDDYRSTSQSYYEYLVEVFKGWHNHPEVLNGNWPSTLQECFAIPREGPYAYLYQYTYPLSDENARKLVDYFIDVYAPSRSSRNDLRDFNGYIFTGPEYLTIFDGETGAELETIRYKPEREDDGLMWGDYAMARIEPCNRVDRMLACVAYLDDNKPCAVFGRGYYTRSTLVAYSWDGEHLKEEWFVDSGHTVMSNPFNDSPHGADGRNPEFATITTQGAHTLLAADVDNDGYDEIISGSCTIDHDGTLLYSSFGTLPQGSAAPGEYVRLGHGDSIHVTDIDPSRPGLEIFMCYEGATWAPYGVALRDAATGEVIWGTYSGRDTGRCMVGDINPAVPGLEAWGIQLRSARGDILTGVQPGTNQNIRWSADMTTQILNGVRIEKWVNGSMVTVLNPSSVSSINGTKGNANLIADVFGDWREELILRKTDDTAFRIYFNTEITGHKLFTLMQDRLYRISVARQNIGYNQPAYTSFYLASDTDWEVLFNSLGIDDTADKSALAELIQQVQLLDKNLYTPESWSVFEEALASAVSVRDNEDATQEEVDNAVNELQNAINNLQLVAVNPVAVLSGSSSVQVDSRFVVNIELKNLKERIYAEDIQVDYDSNLYTFIGIEGANENIMVISPDDETVTEAGKIRIIAANNGGFEEDGVILKLKFQATGKAGESGQISVTRAQLGTADGAVTDAEGSVLKVTIAGIPVTGVRLNRTELKFSKAGASERLTAIITPENATNKEVTWRTSNPSVATVDQNGLVTAVGNGTAVITVETEDGKYTATCQVTVIIGDFNDNDGVDIGDLAIAAYYYNTTSADDNWQQARIADMDNDGDVDIVDLAIIARYILN